MERKEGILVLHTFPDVFEGLLYEGLVNVLPLIKDCLDFLHGYHVVTVSIEKLEGGFKFLFSEQSFIWNGALQELVIVNITTAVCVYSLDQVINFLLIEIDTAYLSESWYKLISGEAAVAVFIELFELIGDGIQFLRGEKVMNKEVIDSLLEAGARMMTFQSG